MTLDDSNTGKNQRRREDKTKILLVDDHALVRQGLAELINGQADLMACGEAEDVETALRLIEETRPDLVIVDLVLGKGSGLELIKEVAARDPDLKMLVCSMHDEALYAERVLAAGALGYVTKREPSRVVLQAIRRVLAGRVYASDEIADRALRRAGGKADQRNGSSIVDALSDRELQVLDLLGDGRNTRQIAEQLELSTKTIDTYREHIKTKLGLKNASELLRFAVAWKLDPTGAPRSDPS